MNVLGCVGVCVPIPYSLACTAGYGNRMVHSGNNVGKLPCMKLVCLYPADLMMNNNMLEQ